MVRRKRLALLLVSVGVCLTLGCLGAHYLAKSNWRRDLDLLTERVDRMTTRFAQLESGKETLSDEAKTALVIEFDSVAQDLDRIDESRAVADTLLAGGILGCMITCFGLLWTIASRYKVSAN